MDVAPRICLTKRIGQIQLLIEMAVLISNTMSQELVDVLAEKYWALEYCSWYPPRDSSTDILQCSTDPELRTEVARDVLQRDASFKVVLI